MLLVDLVLGAAARIWRYREKIEWEAADQFARLAAQLERAGAESAVVRLARQAADDERTHAGLCRDLVDRFEPGTEPLTPALGARLGPADLDPRRRALYAAVALSCVTETLSAALLLRIHRRAQDPVVRSTVHYILKDEIDHGKLGWAHLAGESRRGDVSWLAPYIAGMIRDARATDVEPMAQPAPDATPVGVLRPTEVREVIDTTVSRVIVPGLSRFGILPTRGQNAVTME